MYYVDYIVMCMGDMSGGMLMGSIEGMVKVRGIWKEECY